MVGLVNTLPTTVGGGTVFWDAKVPRFWDIDFAKRSALGPIPGADIDDWPFSYAELAPWYDRAEALLGVQGDLDSCPCTPPSRTRRGTALRDAPWAGAVRVPARRGRRPAIGLHPFPFPMAINSVDHDGRPAATTAACAAATAARSWPAPAPSPRCAWRCGPAGSNCAPQPSFTGLNGAAPAPPASPTWTRGPLRLRARRPDRFGRLGDRDTRLALLSGFPTRTGCSAGT